MSYISCISLVLHVHVLYSMYMSRAACMCLIFHFISRTACICLVRLVYVSYFMYMTRTACICLIFHIYLSYSMCMSCTPCMCLVLHVCVLYFILSLVLHVYVSYCMYVAYCMYMSRNACICPIVHVYLSYSMYISRISCICLIFHVYLSYCMYMYRTSCKCLVLHVNVLYFMYISRSPCVFPAFIVNIYMPTTNVSIDHYRESIADLQIIVDWLSDDGIILMCGDFNGQLGGQCGPRSNSFTNVRGSVLYDFIAYNNMFSSITQESCSGPVHTCWPGDTSYNKFTN